MHVETPVFGEAKWFAMNGWLLLALICLAVWHISLKLIDQLEWHQDESGEESLPMQFLSDYDF
jgi:hypothetical protein